VNANDNDKHNDNDKSHDDNRKLSNAERAAIALKEAELELYREAYEERRQELLDRQRQQHQSQSQKHAAKHKSPGMADDEGLAKIAKAAAASAPVLCDVDEVKKTFKRGDDDDDTESEDDGDCGAEPVEPLDDIVMIASPMSGRRKRLFASKSVLDPIKKPTRKRSKYTIFRVLLFVCLISMVGKYRVLYKCLSFLSIFSLE
jgi:hypothetical protein